MFRYNENIRDLLSARDEYLDLREDPAKVRKEKGSAGTRVEGFVKIRGE